MFKKLFLTAFALGTGLLVYGYSRRMNKTKAELLITPKAILHSIGLNGLIIRIDLLIKNPNAGSFKLRFPFVTILFKGAVIGSSKVVNQLIEIPPYDQASIEKIMIEVPLDSVFSVVTTLIKSLTSGKTEKITIKTKTEANLDWTKVDVYDIQEVTLPPLSKSTLSL